MNPSTKKSFETNTQQPGFQQQIDAITKRSLSPENVDSYAEDALNDLIAVVHQITTTYDRLPIVFRESGADHERAAFSYFGMNSEQIEATLDHVQDVADTIYSLDGIINEMTSSGTQENVPPGIFEGKIESGDGSFEKKKLIPRFKTILLILKERYGIDVDPKTADPETFRIIPGRISEKWMRKTPYHYIELSELNRVIAVCDEEGNRTFVFDRDKLLSEIITMNALKDMTKDDITHLQKVHSELGSHIVYSDKFVPQIIAAIDNVVGDLEEPESDVSQLLVVEKIRSNEMTVAGISIAIFGEKTKRHIIQDAITALGLEGAERSVRSGRTRAFNSDEVLRIREWIIDKGYFEKASLLVRNQIVNRLTNELSLGVKLSNNKVQEVIDELVAEGIFGEIKEIGAKRYFTEEQYCFIKENLMANPKYGRYKERPSTVLSTKELSEEYGVSVQTIEKIASYLGVEAGGYWNGRGYGAGYSHEQNKMIQLELETRGFFKEHAPEGYLSARGMAKSSDEEFNKANVKIAVSALGDVLGEGIELKNTNGQRFVYYSPDQQQMIVDWLDREGYIMPKDMLTLRDLGTAMGGVSREAVDRALKRLEDRGELKPEYVWKRYKTARNQWMYRYSTEVMPLLEDELANSPRAGRIRDTIARKALGSVVPPVEN